MKRSYIKRKTPFKRVVKKSTRRPKNGQNKQLSVSTLKKALDAIFSRFIRISQADDKGMVECYTCYTMHHWKDIQAGHYVSRTHNSLRFDERNVHPQCKACNIFKSGNLDEYALHLMRDYGPRILEELHRVKFQIKQFSAPELQEAIAKYEEKVKIYSA